MGMAEDPGPEILEMELDPPLQVAQGPEPEPAIPEPMLGAVGGVEPDGEAMEAEPVRRPNLSSSAQISLDTMQLNSSLSPMGKETELATFVAMAKMTITVFNRCP